MIRAIGQYHDYGIGQPAPVPTWMQFIGPVGVVGFLLGYMLYISRALKPGRV